MGKTKHYQSLKTGLSTTWRLLRKKRDRREFLYTYFDSKMASNRKNSVLFVDGGANLGQGFKWFSSFFNSPNVVFHLFEPNPNCQIILNGLIAETSKRIKLFDTGISTFDGEVKFYGLSENEGGALSEGGSIKSDHNSGWYKASEEDAITVKVIDFDRYLREQKQVFDKIVVKMDIEGAEIDVLEKLIETGAIEYISVLYVEFHSQFQTEPQRSETRNREENIVRKLKQHGVKVRIWH